MCFCVSVCVCVCVCVRESKSVRVCVILVQLDASQYINMEDSVLDAAARTCSHLVRVNIGGCRCCTGVPRS